MITSCPEPGYAAQAEFAGGQRIAAEAAAKMQKKAEEQVLEDKVALVVITGQWPSYSFWNEV